MRQSTLCLFLLLAGCGFTSARESDVIEDFRGRSQALSCARVSSDLGLAVTELRATTDTSWAVLDAPQRLVRGFDDRLRPLWTVALEPEGPLGMQAPVGLAAAGDTLVYVVDRGGFTLAALDTRTGHGRTVPLEFVPAGVTVLPGGGAVVTALPIGSRPPGLLFVLDADTLRPVDVPQRRYADISINGLGNMVLAEADATGSILVLHQYMSPRAFRVEQNGSVRPLRPPVPDGTAHKRAYVPTAPVSEEAMPLIYVGAAAMSVDRGTGEVFVLTQSGRRVGERSERAIMHLDRGLVYKASYLLDLELNAGHLVYLARRRALLLADEFDGLHLCPLPPRTVAGAPAE